MTIPNYPCYEVKKFGERLDDALCDAGLFIAMGGLGGCKPFDLSDFDEDLRVYVTAYLEGSQDSGAIIYAAMRTKEKELENL